MKIYKFSLTPWNKDLVSKICKAIAETVETSSEEKANMQLVLLAPTLHEVVTKCQAILGEYLEPNGKTKGQAISALLDILDATELVVKLRELES